MDLSGTSVVVPLLDPTLAVPLERPWEPAEVAAPARVTVEGGAPAWTWLEDESPTVVLKSSGGPTTKHFPSGLTTVHDNEIRFLLDPDDPLTAAVETTRSASFAREGWHVSTTLHSHMTCDATSFTVRTRLTASLDGAEVFAEDVSHRIPRDHT